MLEKEANVARLPSLALLPDSRLTQPEDTVVQHVQDGNHTNTVSCTPHTAKPATSGLIISTGHWNANGITWVKLRKEYCLSLCVKETDETLCNQNIVARLACQSGRIVQQK